MTGEWANETFFYVKIVYVEIYMNDWAHHSTTHQDCLYQIRWSAIMAKKNMQRIYQRVINIFQKKIIISLIFNTQFDQSTKSIFFFFVFPSVLNDT